MTKRATIDWGAILGAAWRRRQQPEARVIFADDCECYRLLHGWSEGAFGLEIDRYGDVALIRGKREYNDQREAIAVALVPLVDWRAILFKPWRGGPVEALRGALPDDIDGDPTLVYEHGLRFAVELAQPANPGLHLDARCARRWLREHGGGRRVLDLFAFTGSLGVAAMAGGATSVVHVDSQRGALRRCARNHALNDQAIDQRDLLRGNVYQHLRRSAKRQRFSGIIADPPPYPASARTPTTPRRLESMEGLTSLAAPLLEPGGWLLCLFHDYGPSHDEHEAAVIDAAARVDVELIATTRLWADDDFPADDPNKRLRVTAFERR